MQISKFLASLLPTFSKSDLRKDLDNIADELLNDTLPPYRTAVDVFSGQKFASKDVEAFAKEFKSRVKIQYSGNYIQVINFVLGRIEENLPTIQNLVEKNYSEDGFREAMSFLRINLLQYVEAVGFAVHYSRMLLRWTLNAETAATDDQHAHYIESMAKPELDMLFKRKDAFFDVLVILARPKAEVVESFKEIPDSIATQDNIEIVNSVAGHSRTDPFRFGMIPYWMNPIYHVRMAVAEWQASRYNAAKEERKMLEMKLLNLRQVQAGTPDAALQQQIEYNGDRLKKINAKISEMEEEYL